jgi:hypothetical protein
MKLPPWLPVSFRRELASALRPIRLRRARRLPQPHIPEGWFTAAPDFVGVGVQRAGTSWWFRLLVCHPDVVAPPWGKELHFFDSLWRSPPSPNLLDKYSSFFPRPANKITGEWTPRYANDHWVPPLLSRAASGTSIFFMVRDPVERYVSGLTHDLETGVRPKPSAATEACARGLYASQLERLYEWFPTDNILVLQYERCVEAPEVELQRCCSFLGLRPYPVLPSGVRERVGATRVSKETTDRDSVQHLRLAYRAEVRRLADLFPEIDLTLWPNFADLAAEEE